jgi:hypothetical protein
MSPAKGRGVGVAVGDKATLGRGVGARVAVAAVVGVGGAVVGVSEDVDTVAVIDAFVVAPSGASVAAGAVAGGVSVVCGVVSLPSHATTIKTQLTKKIIAA